ncbi:hypothetical protein C0995_003544 [Termitomyces sp. Mi166|nr:hypothetical protein C0995_003544 [Termitomyces sp. Mi166\
MNPLWRTCAFVMEEIPDAKRKRSALEEVHNKWIFCLALGKDLTEEERRKGCGAYLECGLHYPGDEELFFEYPTYQEEWPTAPT